ncbi:restriction endonuclease subunit S [Bacillus seohaeanensis]|uniref:Restriction endonuclease subunit S n=1 Tax=Bacillus seohaeanensis TaxID=284580 RepID=A0ABW5RWA9_9BACI
MIHDYKSIVSLIREGKVPSGYKETTVGIIPQEWRIIPLADLGFFKNGLNKSKGDFGQGNEMVNLSDVFSKRRLNNKDSFNTKVNCTETELENYSLDKGDVLFVRSSVKPEGVGLTTLIEEDLKEKVYSGFLIRFRETSSEMDTYFKKYCFDANYFRRKLLNFSTISANTNINQQSLQKLGLLLPGIKEQKKIAEVLLIWDKAIDLKKKLINQKKRQHKSLMQKMLTGKIRYNDGNKFSKEELNERLRCIDKREVPNGYKDTKLGIIPNDWSIKKIGEILKPKIREIDKPNKGYWRLGLRSHAKGTFHEFVDDPSKVSMDRLYLVEENDLIVNITFAWEHAIAIADNKDHGKLVSHRFPTYEFNENVYPLFYKYYVIQPYFKYLLENISPGGAGRNRVMSKKDFLKLDIIVPPYDEQQNVAQILLTSEQEINLLNRELNALNEQKEGLMQSLLTGKIRVKV